MGLYGVSTNLVMYLIRELRQGATSAATNTSNWQGVVYFFSVIGGFMGDAYLGRYWASFLFQLLGILVRTFSYVSTPTFHYGPIVSYLTPKEDDNNIYLSIFVAMHIYYVLNAHYVCSYHIKLCKKTIHVPLCT